MFCCVESSALKTFISFKEHHITLMLIWFELNDQKCCLQLPLFSIILAFFVVLQMNRVENQKSTLQIHSDSCKLCMNENSRQPITEVFSLPWIGTSNRISYQSYTGHRILKHSLVEAKRRETQRHKQSVETSW